APCPLFAVLLCGLLLAVLWGVVIYLSVAWSEGWRFRMRLLVVGIGAVATALCVGHGRIVVALWRLLRLRVGGGAGGGNSSGDQSANQGKRSWLWIPAVIALLANGGVV